jgi:hypothetical protein
VVASPTRRNDSSFSVTLCVSGSLSFLRLSRKDTRGRTDHGLEILPASSYFSGSAYGRAASGSRDGADGFGVECREKIIIVKNERQNKAEKLASRRGNDVFLLVLCSRNLLRHTNMQQQVAQEEEEDWKPGRAGF